MNKIRSASQPFANNPFFKLLEKVNEFKKKQENKEKIMIASNIPKFSLHELQQLRQKSQKPLRERIKKQKQPQNASKNSQIQFEKLNIKAPNRLQQFNKTNSSRRRINSMAMMVKYHNLNPKIEEIQNIHNQSKTLTQQCFRITRNMQKESDTLHRTSTERKVQKDDSDEETQIDLYGMIMDEKKGINQVQLSSHQLKKLLITGDKQLRERRRKLYQMDKIQEISLPEKSSRILN